jgi:rod shape-determining protein MreB
MATSNLESPKEAVKAKPKEKSAAAPTLLVGIDLGTSHTAIACSNGKRSVVTSYVGKPKDAISEKLFGKRLLFGEEAQKNRLAVHLYRPLEKGVIKVDGADQSGNLEAVRALLQHAVSLVSPAPGDVIYGVIGAPARASFENKKAILDAVKGILHGAMIVSEPFAVAYRMDVLNDALIVDIGAGTTDLCRMHGTFPEEEDQITNSFAGDHVDQTLADLIQKRYPEAQFSANMIKSIKEKHGYVSESAGKVEVELTVNGRPRPFDITAELKTACRSIVPAMVDGLHKLIGSFDPEFQAKLRNNVIVAGGGSQMQGLRLLIEEGLKELGGGKVLVVDEPVYAGANGGLKIAAEMPMEYWEQVG